MKPTREQILNETRKRNAETYSRALVERDEARALARKMKRERDALQKKYSLSLEQLSYWMTLYELTVKERDEARAENKRYEKYIGEALQPIKEL